MSGLGLSLLMQRQSNAPRNGCQQFFSEFTVSSRKGQMAGGERSGSRCLRDRSVRFVVRRTAPLPSDAGRFAFQGRSLPEDRVMPSALITDLFAVLDELSGGVHPSIRRFL